MVTFIHERLDVYRAAVEFLVLAQGILCSLPRGHGHAEISDQLRRAAMSVVLNIAEGAGEFSVPEKRRFYRIALRSGNECAAILEVLRVFGLTDASSIESARTTLGRTVRMLTALALRQIPSSNREPIPRTANGEPATLPTPPAGEP